MEKSEVTLPITITLNGSNYNQWAEAMCGFLKGRRLWRYVTGDKKSPTKSANDTLEAYADKLEEWDSKNHQIITWFRNTSTLSIHLQFGRFENAKEVWDHLKQRYTISDLSHQYQLLKDLNNLKQQPGQPVYEFLAQMEVIWNQLSSCEPSLKNAADLKAYETHRDRIRLIQFLMALTDDYEPVRASLLHQNPLPTLENALPCLKSEETRLGLDRPQPDVAFAATNKTSKFCRHCRKPGHSFSDCPTVECHNCMKKGHIASNCCRYCKTPGHLIHNCPTRPPRSDQNRNPHRPNSSKPALATTAATNESSESSQPPFSISDIESLLRQLLPAGNGNTPAALSTTPGNPKWHMDSACCNHMTSKSHLFSSLSKNDTPCSIHTADGSLMHASHMGPISASNLSLPDTYFIPNLNFNLISIGQLVDSGYEVNFSSSGCRVQDEQTGQLIGTGCKVRRVFELTQLHVPPVSNICAASTDSSIELWHRRLAHSSIGKLRPLMSQGHLGSVTNESFDCTACQTAKQPALSFNKSTSISDSPFDLVHSDIWGPALTPTMGGSRYFVLFIDDYSLFTWIYMMKNRHELPQIYINFAKMIQTQFSKKIKVFRRDNAMEYRDSKLLSFLDEQGTLSEFSCPYTSQQNGRAERKHRHILDSVRAMLISASCPERAWGEAALTAVHIINRLPSSVLGNVSPFERLFHTTPDYTSLKVFGCACFVLLNPNEYTKLEPRARLCCFLGYGTEHKGYRCWDPISQRIRISRHVVFWEHIMFSSLSKFTSISPTSTVFFTDPDVDYFSSDTDAGLDTCAGSSSELHTPSDVPSTSGDDVPTVDPAPPTIELPQRVRNPPAYLRNYHCFSTMLHLHEPQSYKEASLDPHWQQAMKEELQALEKTHMGSF